VPTKLKTSYLDNQNLSNGHLSPILYKVGTSLKFTSSQYRSVVRI
jgi:hypothetical protein